MQSVIDMNNEAALLLESGHYKRALSILIKALATVQTELASKEPDETDDSKGGNSQSAVYSCRPARAQQLKSKAIENFEESDHDFIYRHPIRAIHLPLQDEEYIISVILVFNMALSHHLTAIEGERGDYENQLLGALKLYELGFCMQMRGDVHMDMTYALAMVNNCAQIYKAMNRQQKAQKFFRHMLSSLMMMIENGEAETVDELDGFLWNASRLILEKAVAPAA
jgi:tetratricopeptide (TPR) repeat protein